ncbi:MAG: hypothetical protein DRJ42_30165 [Deltaproteobacteria bacterium]|nr:MAG: hypothetical protein DRJ42_30165 [Deltaproteobacteria bacterium]
MPDEGRAIFLLDVDRNRRGHPRDAQPCIPISSDGAVADGPARVTNRPDDSTKSYPAALNEGRVLLNEVFEPWEDWSAPKPCNTVIYDVGSGAQVE